MLFLSHGQAGLPVYKASEALPFNEKLSEVRN